ncbi:MAG TPA: hypothetical protein VH702_14155 [Vicinamibacterales bacterium]
MEAQPVTWPIPAEYLRGANNPWMRLGSTLKHDRVPFDHHDHCQIAFAHHTDNLTVASASAKRLDIALLSRLHFRPTTRFAAERTEDCHLRILFEYRRRSPFQLPVNPSRPTVVQSLDQFLDISIGRRPLRCGGSQQRGCRDRGGR